MNEIERDIVRFKHILEECENIASFLGGDKTSLLTARALERSLQIIGEACRTISPTSKSDYSKIPWADIIGMRNILVHEYYRVDVETIWDVAEHKIPALKDWIIGILEKSNDHP